MSDTGDSIIASPVARSGKDVRCDFEPVSKLLHKVMEACKLPSPERDHKLTQFDLPSNTERLQSGHASGSENIIAASAS